VFLTVCTRNREKWLATHEVHALLRAVWTDASAWLVGRCVIVPDHLHLFAGPNGQGVVFDNWSSTGSRSSASATSTRLTAGSRTTPDRRLRDGESYEQKWEYTRGNPVRHGLVKRVEDWPYQGELNQLPW
jgi:REP element-mobilizing transposase RayT